MAKTRCSSPAIDLAAPVGYRVFSQKRGENGWSISRFVPLGEVDQLCEVIERYCTHSLV